MPAQPIQDRDMAGQTVTQRSVAAWFAFDALERVVREHGRAALSQHNRERARMAYPHNKLEFEGGFSEEQLAELLEKCHDRLDQIVAKNLPDLSRPKSVTRRRRETRGRKSEEEESVTEPTSSTSKEIFTIPEAAAYLGMSQNQIRSLDQNGALKRKLHPGRNVLFTRKELDRFREHTD